MHYDGRKAFYPQNTDHHTRRIKIQLNFDNYLDKMRGCWNGKNIGGTLGAPFEGMRGVFDVRYYTVFQNSLIRAYVDGHEAPYISEGTVKKNNDHLRESTAPPAVAHADAAHAEGLEVQPGKTLAVNLEQGHCNVPLARVTLEVTPHALSRARNDLIIQVVSEGRPTQLFIPIILLASGDYQIFSE